MDYKSTAARLAEFRSEIAAIRKKMRAAQAAAESEEVADYEFATPEGTAKLSELFAGKADLILIHNTGTTCPNCTLWADGLNGIYHHLAARAAVVISSPDPPAVQQKFAASRGWTFPMISHQGTSFAEDMGYRSKRGGWLPGLSVFRHDGKRILRVSDASFEPGDDFCALWHILDLLPGGAGDWTPRFSYPQGMALHITGQLSLDGARKTCEARVETITRLAHTTIGKDADNTHHHLPITAWQPGDPGFGGHKRTPA